MTARRQVPETKRRIPRQARATQTAAAILEGASQILEMGGLSACTTNAVAERAGVSIGTLYQYFADKNAILLALAKQEIALALAEVGRAARRGRPRACRQGTRHDPRDGECLPWPQRAKAVIRGPGAGLSAD